MQAAIIVRASKWRRSLVVAFALTGALPAQDGVPPRVRFDVASVKPNRTDGCRGRWDFSTTNGTLRAVNAPLLRIVSRAYNLTDDRVAGPQWMESECYDIVAKAPAGASERDVMRMLQSLLEERFHLVARLEAEERQVLALLPDKGGPKIPRYGDDVPAPPFVNDGRVVFMARRLHDLRERLGKVTGRPVVDKTGLEGDYLIVLTYLPLGSTGADATDPASDIVSAVRSQLGLRLEPQRGSVEMLKISSVDKIPTEN